MCIIRNVLRSCKIRKTPIGLADRSFFFRELFQNVLLYYFLSYSFKSSGIAGGADVILLPEIPYDIDKVAEVVENRFAAGKKFSIIAVAEGAISKEDAELPKKKYKEKLEARAKKYPSVSYEIADQINQVIGSEVRVTVPGHIQRGGEPCPYDRVLSTRLGARAAKLIVDEEYGYMVGIVNGETCKVPLGEVAGKLKMVDPNSGIIEEAKMIGISFGD